MEWLNYHHLLYFWWVAREGTVARASAELRLAQPTISGQIRQLEGALGEKLFARKGRNLVLTDTGRVVYGYADEIFSLGRELLEAVKGRAPQRPLRLMVGVADALPKPIARLLLEPALRLGQPVRLICREDRPVEEFLAELAVFALDVVLSDAPAGPGIAVKAFNHLLGECGTSFFASKEIAAARRSGFPGSLDGAPLLVPGDGSSLRRVLEQWISSQDLRPTIVGEFDDPALMNAFGEDGVGIFAAPTILEAELRRRHQVEVVGRVESLRQRFYAISVERKLTHPAVIAIRESARRDLFR
ncbi:MAG TPA: transcriptional activator NhaR [Anaeromyxobacter sp.]|nr:transcriptional activator NhaR [Anaeromyxobacter sp.]